MPRMTARPFRRRRLGHLPDAEDDRDLKLAAPAAMPEWDETIDFRADCPPVVSQGATSSCVGQSWKAAFEIKESLMGLPHEPLSALQPYYHSRRMTQPRGPLFDGGTYIRDCARVVRKLGMAPEETWPFTNLFRRVGRRPPPRVDVGGFERSGGTFYKILEIGDAKLRAIADALMSGDPIVFGTRVSRSFMSNEGPLVIEKPDAGDPIVGGHAMVIVGCRWRSGFFEVLVRNSWGTGWREGGYAWLSTSFVLWPHMRDLCIFRGWQRLEAA